MNHAATSRRLRRVQLIASLAAAASALALTGTAHSQDWNAMLNQQNAYLEQQIQQSQARMNAQLQQGQQQINQIVQQKMQDPRVQAAYRQHLATAQTNGTQPYDFPTFAYYYAATNGFSQQGVAQYNQTERANQAAEQRAYQGYRQAQDNRAAAQSGYMEGYHRNQQEAGRQLQGNSTYVNGYTGQQQVLPHTWQANTYNQYQGNTYFVDQSGQYWMADPNGSGSWIRMQQGR